jgi:peptide deformylase
VVRIVTSPDPILRKKCEPVELSELKKIKATAKQMAKLMYKTNGCGLAAPQIGLSKQLIVIDTNVADDNHEQDPVFYVNPQVKRLWGKTESADEGCLSIPGISIAIERYENIEIVALDLDGEQFTVEACGFEARALQHELDHLDGKTMFEHLDPIARIDALKEYKEAVANGAKPGDTGDKNTEAE